LSIARRPPAGLRIRRVGRRIVLRSRRAAGAPAALLSERVGPSQQNRTGGRSQSETARRPGRHLREIHTLNHACGGRMRTLKTTVGFLVLFVLLSPAPAHAWWGWLDELSGPGRFRGPQFDFRLVCFGPSSEAKRLVDDFRHAEALTNKLVVGADAKTGEAQVPRADVVAAYESWRQLVADLHAVPVTFPVLDSDDLKPASTWAADLRARLKL